MDSISLYIDGKFVHSLINDRDYIVITKKSNLNFPELFYTDQRISDQERVVMKKRINKYLNENRTT